MLVRPGGDWDHKPILLRDLQLGRGDYHFPLLGDTEHEYFYDIWSNIHYGYVGRAAGFFGFELQAGHRVSGIAGSTDAIDIETVQIGIDLWDRYDSKLTKEGILKEILERTKKLLELQGTKEYIEAQKKGINPDFKHLQPITDGK